MILVLRPLRKWDVSRHKSLLKFLIIVLELDDERTPFSRSPMISRLTFALPRRVPESHACELFPWQSGWSMECIRVLFSPSCFSEMTWMTVSETRTWIMTAENKPMDFSNLELIVATTKSACNRQRIFCCRLPAASKKVAYHTVVAVTAIETIPLSASSETGREWWWLGHFVNRSLYRKNEPDEGGTGNQANQALV